MESILILLVLAIFGLPIVLSIVAMSNVGRLTKEVENLRLQVQFLTRQEGAQSKTQSSEAANPTQVPGEKRVPRAPVSEKPLSSEPTKNAMPAISTGQNWSEKATALKSSAPQRRKPKREDRPKKPKKTFEELVGAQGSVWVGGLVLLIGAIFLLRYSIEAGVFTPAMRISMAGLLGVILLGAGEWLHRVDLKKSLTGRGAAIAKSIEEKAYIPTLLTAIGIFTLYGTLYAAFALYGFIGPFAAFTGLGLISLFSLALSYRHGAVLAAIGLAGSLITPLLIQTDTPNIYMLYGYLIIVAATALWVARARGWAWLNVATLFGLLFWSFMSFNAVKDLSTMPVWYGFLGLGFIVNLLIAESAKKTDFSKSDIKALEHNPSLSYLWVGLAALLCLLALFDSTVFRPYLIASLAAVAAVMGSAWVFGKQPWHTVIGALFGFCVLMTMQQNDFAPTVLIAVGALISAAFIGFVILQGKLLDDNSRLSKSLIWAAMSAAYPIATVLWVYDQFRLTDSLYPAGAMAGTFLILAGLAYYLYQRTQPTKQSASPYAIGSATAYVAASLMGLNGLAETVALMGGIALALVAAWIFKGTILRFFIPVLALLSLGHSLCLRIAYGDVRETLILNELIVYFAVPAVLCAVAAKLLSMQKSDLASEGCKALSLTFGVLFVIFQIRHIMNGGDVLAYRLSFDELSLQVLTGLSFTLGATRLAPHKWNAKGDLHTRIIPTLAMAISSVSLVLFVLGVCLFLSPLFNDNEFVKGNWVLNSLVLGYLIPALFLGFIANALKGRRPETYIRLLGGLALVSLILYATTLIRFGFSGPMISIFEQPPEGLELYAISAIWLLLGVGFLVAGLKFNRKDLRLASAALITLTVLKAFLVDMAELEGVLRAVSFVVLGLILIVIGRSYQKILFTQSEDGPMTEADDIGERQSNA